MRPLRNDAIYMLPAAPRFAKLAAKAARRDEALVLGGQHVKAWLDRTACSTPVSSLGNIRHDTRRFGKRAIVSFPELYSVMPDDAICIDYRGRMHWFSVVESYLAIKYGLGMRVPKLRAFGLPVQWEPVAPPTDQSIEAVRALQRKALALLEIASLQTAAVLPSEHRQGDVASIQTAISSKLLALRTKAIRHSIANGQALDLAAIKQIHRRAQQPTQ